jgi:hypothetical protein
MKSGTSQPVVFFRNEGTRYRDVGDDGELVDFDRPAGHI